MSRPPWSATVTGLIAAVGTVIPALITAPAAPVAEAVELLVDEADDDELLLQAAMIDPSSGTEMPTTVPRRTKSRRDSRPAANSSMMWLAISPWPWRRRASRRWSILRVTGASLLPFRVRAIPGPVLVFAPYTAAAAAR